jgi:lipopolysaccharide export system permease protein
MKIISRYLAQEFISNILLVMLGLLFMFAFFDLLQELDSIGKGNYGITKVIAFVLLSSPGHVYQVVPVAVLIGTMHTLGQFARNSELVVLRVSGVSIASLAIKLLSVGAVFAVLTFLVGELITPISEKTAQRLRIKATDSVVAQEFRSGLWIKDGLSFVNVENVLPDAELLNIHVYEFDETFKLRLISDAKSARYEQNAWTMRDITQTVFKEDKVLASQYKKAVWQSLIRPELLNVLLVVPEKMSTLSLFSYINHLQANKQKTTRHEIALWSKLVYPLACVVMVLLALPFGFIQQRSGGVGAKILVGIMLGISYQILNRVFVHLGLLNDWSPFFSATLPTAMFLMTAVVMLFVVERR